MTTNQARYRLIAIFMKGYIYGDPKISALELQKLTRRASDIVSQFSVDAMIATEADRARFEAMLPILDALLTDGGTIRDSGEAIKLVNRAYSVVDQLTSDPSNDSDLPAAVLREDDPMETLTIGGRQIPVTENTKMLFTSATQIPGTNAGTFVLGQTPYAPGVGKKLKLISIRGVDPLSGQPPLGIIWAIGYADNNVGQSADPAGLVNSVFLIGDATPGSGYLTEPNGEAAVFGEIPAGKYPFVLLNAASNHSGQIVLYGEEEDA